MSACGGCGVVLPPQERGRPRKWCSEWCRKRSYDKPCIDCGTLVDGTTPSRCGGRCIPCNAAHACQLSRQWILDSFAEWEERFGVPPSAMDWNPSLARAKGMEWKAERYEGTGRPWPSTSLVQDRFGSWNAGRQAAGFETFEAGQYGRDGEDPAVIAETAALYREGLPVAQIARRMGVSQSGVQHRLERSGVPRRPTGRPRKAVAA